MAFLYGPPEFVPIIRPLTQNVNVFLVKTGGEHIDKLSKQWYGNHYESNAGW
jgi:hypothetical protein